MYRRAGSSLTDLGNRGLMPRSIYRPSRVLHSRKRGDPIPETISMNNGLSEMVEWKAGASTVAEK